MEQGDLFLPQQHKLRADLVIHCSESLPIVARRHPFFIAARLVTGNKRQADSQEDSQSASRPDLMSPALALDRFRRRSCLPSDQQSAVTSSCFQLYALPSLLSPFPELQTTAAAHPPADAASMIQLTL